MTQDEDHSPSWLDPDYDESHRTEIVAPLFGTGTLSLIDTDEQRRQQEAISERMRRAAQAAVMTTTTTTSPTNYGSLLDHEDGDTGHAASSVEDDEEEEEEEDDTDKEDEERQPLVTKKTSSVVTTTSGASSSSKASATSSPRLAVPQVLKTKNKWWNKTLNTKAKKTKSKKGTTPPPTVMTILATGKPEMPHRNCWVALFFFIEGFGIIISLCLITTQVLPLVVAVQLDQWQAIGMVSVLLKLYLSCFCILFVLVEWDVPIAFLKASQFLQTYMSRGFLYSFIGLTCMQEAYSERITDMVTHSQTQADQMFHVSWISLFMQVSSWMMVGLGVVYMILGICCLQRIRNKVVKRYREQWTLYREALQRYKMESRDY
jgi:hypothetical protein